jgi:dephospho-CoA kinase
MARQGCVIIQPNTLHHSPVAQRRIGLTGGIATGKSSAARLLEQHHGLPVLDADLYARQALEPGQPATEAVLERFGPGVVSSGGVVDRRALGAIVFNNQDERRWLEQQVHPIVRQRFDQELVQLDTNPAVVLMIPLLFESGLEALCSETWLVDCDESQQLQRLMARDQLNEAEAQARMDAQWPLARKRPLADVLISNRGDAAALNAQLEDALSP